MDPDRVDALARTLAHRPTRRLALGVLLAAGAAGTGLWQGRREAVRAQHKGGNGGKGGKGKGKGCKASTKKCGNRCIPASSCCKSAECNLCREQVCTNGRCGCAPGAFEFNGVCGTPPVCLVVDEHCERDDDCCSQECTIVDDDGSRRCNNGVAQCVTNLDCRAGFTCQGFSCSANASCP